MSEEAFPFLSLPGEVRNIIYRNALVAQDSVHILDMHPDQYMTMKRSAKRFRDRYQTASTVCTAKAGIGCSYHLHQGRRSHLQSESGSLTHEQGGSTETHPIFYQENTFFFYSMSAVMPFLRDRTPESLANIKCIGFHLEIDGYIERNPVYLNWVCIFREVSCMAGLKLRDLSLKIKGRRYGPSHGGWGPTSGLNWVYSITRIGGLQGLHIEFDLGSTENPSHERRERMIGAERVNAHGLWCWLAPRMLTDRKEAVAKAAAYLKGDEAARENDCLFVLDGVKGGEMAWDLRKAME